MEFVPSLTLTVWPWAKVFLEQALEFLEEPVSQNHHLFPGLEIQDQSGVENDYAASELGVFQVPERKNTTYAFTAKFLSQRKIAARFLFVFLTHLSFLLSPSAKLISKAAAIMSLLF